MSMIIQRNIYKEIEPFIDSPEAIIITGMRRVGKTTLLNFIYDKISSSNKMVLDLENPLNQKYFEEEDYEKIKQNLEFLGIDLSQPSYLFLDEIQFVKNLPSIVKYLYDHYKIKFFLTGSASFYLKNLFSESLSGRKYIFELYPLDFREFLLSKREKLVLPKGGDGISETTFKTFERLYNEYLVFGGFPGVVTKESVREKRMALSDIFTSYFQLEVVRLGEYRKNSVIRDLILLLMQRIGSKLDIAKLAVEIGVSRPTLYNYLDFLEGTYFLKRIKPYSTNKDVEIRGAEKVYLCDSGLVNNMVKVSEGALFENNIFQLLKLKGEINYYQRKSGAEIDFILDKKRAFEVKLSTSIHDLHKLQRLCGELKIKDFRLISRKYSALAEVEYGFLL